MARLMIQIDLNNAAFEDDPGEVQKVLARVAERVNIHSAEDGGTVMDTYGNTCGTWHFDHEDLEVRPYIDGGPKGS